MASARWRGICGRGGHRVNVKRVRRLMRLMGLMPIYQRPRTSIPAKGHKIYPYLLRGVMIERPNQVWCADITYIPLARGFLYLVAIMDWSSRTVLAWRLSNTMDVQFCVDALDEALGRYGAPEIFNTDQGSQLTSWAWTQRLRGTGIRISMDGRGRFLDNIFIERLWRSLKYECVYLHAFSGGRDARNGIGKWVDFYNNRRPPLLPAMYPPRRRTAPYCTEIETSSPTPRPSFSAALPRLTATSTSPDAFSYQKTCPGGTSEKTRAKRTAVPPAAKTADRSTDAVRMPVKALPKRSIWITVKLSSGQSAPGRAGSPFQSNAVCAGTSFRANRAATGANRSRP